MADISRTILVPIDLHGINRRTLETLVCIARQLDRGLLGLLLEDLKLQRVADLPFTTEITLSGGRERNLEREQLTLRHNQVSEVTRRLLNELADRERVAVSFEHAAGGRWHTALERDAAVDIFFPAQHQWRTPGATLQRGDIKRLGILLSNTELDTKLLGVAAALLRAGLVGDTYILCSKAPLPEQLHTLYQQGHQVRVQANVRATPAAVTRLLQQSPYDLLLLSRQSLAGIPPGLLDASLDKSGSQILVVN